MKATELTSIEYRTRACLRTVAPDNVPHRHASHRSSLHAGNLLRLYHSNHPHRSVVRLVASTRFIERIGDEAAADLLARHDRSARELLASFNGREIDKSDGFLLLFERPIEAVRFAIAYQAKLRELGTAYDAALVARVGIHLGEVTLRENSSAEVARGAKPLEVEGLAKAMAARVMSLAGDGRVLLKRAAFDVARRAAVAVNGDSRLRWLDHGAYRLAGIEEPVAVFEVAEADAAVSTRPTSSEKAQRLENSSSDRAPASSDDRSDPLLAVLAFDNLSSDPEMQFFSDGVSEEIINRLSRGAKLRVIGRTSSFQFRGERKAEAASRLNCSHVLDGAIRRAAARVRILRLQNGVREGTARPEGRSLAVALHRPDSEKRP